MSKYSRYLKWNYIILVVIILLGLGIRMYHIDYPVVGYHNWKETHYLTEARNFAENGFFEHGFFVPSWDYPSLTKDPSGAHSDTFPTVPIIIGFLFKIFGPSLFIARLVGVLFIVGTIPLIYLLAKKVFKREDAALLSSFFFAINPLYVFFSHNVQLINASIFFLILSLYLFEVWRETLKNKFLIYTTLAFTLAALTKYSFAVVGVLFLIRFPFKELKNKKNYKTFFYCFLILLAFVGWFLYANQYLATSLNSTPAVRSGTINFSSLLSEEFKQSFKLQILDNYTNLFFIISILGLIPAFMLRKKVNYPFHLILTGIVFFPIMANKVKGHSYHQYPIAFAFIFLAVFFIMFVLDTAMKLLKSSSVSKKSLDIIKVLAVLLLCFFVYKDSEVSWNRQFDTQFPGLDIAGEYVNEHKLPGERAIHSSHQAYGFLWHGDIKGTRGIPDTLEKVKFAEDNLNATWLFVYNWDFHRLQDGEIAEYFRSNYHLEQIAFQQTQQGNAPIYFLLKKGGTFPLNDLNSILETKAVNSKQYENSRGTYSLQYINI